MWEVLGNVLWNNMSVPQNTIMDMNNVIQGEDGRDKFSSKP